MFKKTTTLAMLLMFCLLSLPVLSAGLPGTTDTVFNKKFVFKMKPMMPYEKLAEMIGTQGKKMGDGKAYHWDGDRKSALDAKVVAGKVVDFTVVSPKGKRYTLGKKGQLLIVTLGD